MNLTENLFFSPFSFFIARNLYDFPFFLPIFFYQIELDDNRTRVEPYKNCSKIDYFSTEEYHADPNDSTNVLPCKYLIGLSNEAFPTYKQKFLLMFTKKWRRTQENAVYFYRGFTLILKPFFKVLLQILSLLFMRIIQRIMRVFLW